MRQRPQQRPHPPLWYGTNAPQSAGRCARERLNMVTLATGDAMARMLADYRAAYAASGGAPEHMPFIGVGRHVVVADTDAQARAIATPAFARWRAHFVHLWETRGGGNPFVAAFPRDWDAVEASGAACAGSPATVRAFVARHAAAGCTYFCAQLAFGGLTLGEVSRSARLFAAEVMPAFSA
jgi:alkanesulfonate monooxygenase SsuD/methylene tetrahydromethanopterin reductase-like flavin-dependent oxidoreductase (luciferase family)